MEKPVFIPSFAVNGAYRMHELIIRIFFNPFYCDMCSSQLGAIVANKVTSFR